VGQRRFGQQGGGKIDQHHVQHQRAAAVADGGKY